MMRTAETAVRVGALFEGRYEILEELGGGSFGRVFKARQRSTGQLVAVKVLRLGRDIAAGSSHNSILRFRREAQVCAELSHPNIVRLIDSGEAAGGELYAAFEFVPGATLKDVLVAEEKLTVAEAVHLMAQVLDALSCAHARGIVHRDLKPENVMVAKTGARRNALVLDFGLGGFAREAEARLLPRITATQELLGTPCYAAPEQLRGEPPSLRSDLYSWGLMFLECLTGDLPVRGASAQEVILKQLGPEPVPIPRWLRNHPLGRLLELVTNKHAEKRDVPTERLLRLLATMGAGEVLEPAGLRSDDQVVETERRQLTIVCCRLTISADDGRQLDVEELDHLLQTQRAAIAERAARAGGTVATVLADRVFLVFGYPQAREEDTRHAVRLALEVAGSAASLARRELRFDVRVGVHTGLVIVPDLRHRGISRLQELRGLTPQIASQLVEHAGPGEVLVSLETQRLLRHEFESKPAGECAMRELSHALPVFRLTGVRRTAMGTASAAGAYTTPLVGRASQLQQLLDGWMKVAVGNSAAVLITGEAGIGKTRLVHELRQRVGADAWIECDCAPEDQTAPLRPVIDALLVMDQSIEALLTRYGCDLAQDLPLFAALLSIPLDERYAPLHLSPERQKELTLQALVNLVFKMAEQRPIVLAMENLHWADPTTLALTTLLLQELRTARYIESQPGPQLFVVFTARPELIPPWSGEDVAVLPLPRLMGTEVEEMVRAGLAREEGLPPALVEEVVQRAEGVPLFVEEITRVVLESVGVDVPDVAFPPSAVEIPATLRDLLTARLDGVSPGARDTAQLAAVIGREFSYDVLQAVSHKDAAFLRDDIAELGRAGLVLHRRSGRGDSYVFRHALLRDAAYEALTRPTRLGLHRRVAHALRQHFPDIEQRRPEILALHFEQGGEIEAAIGYWHRAGDQSLRRAAYAEAVHQLERGLALVQRMGVSAERARAEIELLTTLGTALLMTKGYSAADVGNTFAHAWELCERLGEEIPLKVLYGIWAVQLTRSDREAVDKLVPEFQRLTVRTGDSVAAITAHAALGVNAGWRGNFVEAETHLAKGRDLYAAEAVERSALDESYDVGLYCYGFGLLNRWYLGYPEQAVALRRELFAIVERSRNPYSISLALANGTVLAYWRGEADAALQMSDQLIELATEQRLYLWLALGKCARGGALILLGKAEEAVAVLQEGLGFLRSTGMRASYSSYLTYLAAAYRDAGRLVDGLAVVDEALALSRTLVAQCFASEAFNLKGELLLHSDAPAAEGCWREALRIAQQQHALSYQLRAVTSLSGLLATMGRRVEAAQLLGSVYARFTEGFDTPDLRKAASLLSSFSA